MTKSAPTKEVELDDRDMHPAKYALIGLFGLAIIAAFGGWWYAAALQQRAIKLWTPEHARLIVQGDKFDVLQLTPLASEPAADQETLSIKERKYLITQRREASGEKGQLNIRYAFLNDNSYDWSTEPASAAAQWNYALRFSKADLKTTLAIDTVAARACLVETGTEIGIQPMLAGLMKFLDFLFAVTPTP